MSGSVVIVFIIPSKVGANFRERRAYSFASFGFVVNDFILISFAFVFRIDYDPCDILGKDDGCFIVAKAMTVIKVNLLHIVGRWFCFIVVIALIV